MTRLKKILLYAAGILAFVFLLAWVLAVIYEDQIKKAIVTSINSNLNTPVHVEEIDFSFLRSFPYATLEFTNIQADGNFFNETKQPLLKAHKLNLNFSILDVFSSSVTVNNISVSDGESFIYINRNQETNYDIWKQGNGESSTIDLKKVTFSSMNLKYVNKISLSDYSFKVRNALLKGKFSATQYQLDINSEMLVLEFTADKVNYIKNKEVAIALSLDINKATDTYQLKPSQIRIADLEFKADGRITGTGDGNLIALNIKAADAGLKDIFSLVPSRHLQSVEDFNFDGRVKVAVGINGLLSKKNTPLVDIKFETANAQIIPKGSDHRLSNIRLKGNYVNRKSSLKSQSFLTITEFNANLDHQPLSGSITVDDLTDPRISAKARGTVNLETLSAFYKPDTLSRISGQLKVNLDFSGLLNKVETYRSTGEMTLENVAFSIKDKTATFNSINGRCSFNANTFSVNNISGLASGSDFNLNGNINNLFSFIFRKNNALSGVAQLTSRNLDLNELLEDKSQSTAKDTAYYLDIDDRLNIVLHLNLGIVSFRKFQAWNVKGDISIRNKAISSNSLAFKSMSGNINLSGSINAQQKDIIISFNTKVKGIDINELFADMGNFGQKVITSDNLRGKLTADVNFSGAWTKELECDKDRINVKSSFVIDQGELNNFKPMLALSKYMKGADLQHIVFSTLSNTIEIKGQKIYIPQMEIKSSAMQMTASGTHTFDNMVDYRLQMLLSQLVSKKVRQMNTEFGTIEDDGLGRTKVFLTMKGPLADPQVKYDSKGVEEKITQDIKSEKQNLKGVLKKEFGWYSKDTAAVKDPPKKKKQELQIDTDDDQ